MELVPYCFIADHLAVCGPLAQSGKSTGLKNQGSLVQLQWGPPMSEGIRTIALKQDRTNTRSGVEQFGSSSGS